MDKTNNNGQEIIAFADKTILKISNVSIKGLNTKELENSLMEKLNTIVRIIGVTGENIAMDIYNLNPEDVLKDAQGIIKAVSLTEGIKAQNIIDLSAEKAVQVDIDK
ncbi:MAG: hypothetical protein GYA50_08570, partial [Eubacteriaceae bacterium]|nr:hypothetical protein [Eubacteriaceae bacterium]